MFPGWATACKCKSCCKGCRVSPAHANTTWQQGVNLQIASIENLDGTFASKATRAQRQSEKDVSFPMRRSKISYAHTTTTTLPCATCIISTRPACALFESGVCQNHVPWQHMSYLGRTRGGDRRKQSMAYIRPGTSHSPL